MVSGGQHDCEIAIVGCGPAGAATALFLAHAAPELAERLLLLDKATFPREKVCAGGIGARADRLLESIGVKVSVPAATVHGLSVKARCSWLIERLPRPIGRVVRRAQYDAALLDQVRERGIQVREGVTLLDLRRRARGVALETSAGALTCAALVGADGVGSAVRRSLGMPRGPYHAQAVEVDTDVVASDLERDLLHFDITDRACSGYAWDFPTVVDGRAMVCRGVYQLTRGVDARRDHDVDALLRRRLSTLGIDPTGLRFKRFAERGLPLFQPAAVERVLLAGEAAGIDPVLGEGIAQAILYGRAAGDYLATCWRRHDYRFGDYRKVLRRSRVGWDLRVRAGLVLPVYGWPRPLTERWVTRSRDLAHAGMAYFAGEPVDRQLLRGAALDLGRAALQTLTGR